MVTTRLHWSFYLLTKKRFDSYTAIFLSLQCNNTRQLLIYTQPEFWKRYVDDTCVALPADQCEAFYAHVNSVEQTIQFTLERESDGKPPFLDLLLERRPDGSISMSVFWKSTHTDRYLDFDSHHPLTHKTAVICMLQYRARMLSSSVRARQDEESHLMDVLVRNGYPRKLIRQHMRDHGRVEESVDGQPEATVCLP